MTLPKKVFSDLQAAVKAANDAELSKTFTPLEAIFVAISTGKSPNNPGLHKLAQHLASPSFLSLYSTLPHLSLPLIAALLKHVLEDELEEIWSAVGAGKAKEKGRFGGGANEKRGEAWEGVVEGVLRGLKLFCQGLEERDTEAILEDKLAVGTHCFTSLQSLLTSKLHIMIKRRTLDVLEYSISSCSVNKLRLAKVEYLGPNVLANIIASSVDQGLTERALDLAFRIGLEILHGDFNTTGKATNKVNKAKWDSDIFPAKRYGGAQKGKQFLETYRELKAKDYDDAKPDFLKMLSGRDLSQYVVLSSSPHPPYAPTNRVIYSFQTFDFVGMICNGQNLVDAFDFSINKDSLTAVTIFKEEEGANGDEDDGGVLEILEMDLKMVKSVEMRGEMGPSGEIIIVNITLTKPPLIDSILVKSQKGLGNTVSFDLDGADGKKFEEVLKARGVTVNHLKTPANTLPTPGKTPSPSIKKTDKAKVAKANATTSGTTDKSATETPAKKPKSPVVTFKISPRKNPPQPEVHEVGGEKEIGDKPAKMGKEKDKGAVAPWLVENDSGDVRDLEGDITMESTGAEAGAGRRKRSSGNSFERINASKRDPLGDDELTSEEEEGNEEGGGGVDIDDILFRKPDPEVNMEVSGVRKRTEKEVELSEPEEDMFKTFTEGTDYQFGQGGTKKETEMEMEVEVEESTTNKQAARTQQHRALTPPPPRQTRQTRRSSPPPPPPPPPQQQPKPTSQPTSNIPSTAGNKVPTPARQVAKPAPKKVATAPATNPAPAAVPAPTSKPKPPTPAKAPVKVFVPVKPTPKKRDDQVIQKKKQVEQQAEAEAIEPESGPMEVDEEGHEEVEEDSPEKKELMRQLNGLSKAERKIWMETLKKAAAGADSDGDGDAQDDDVEMEVDVQQPLFPVAPPKPEAPRNAATSAPSNKPNLNSKPTPFAKSTKPNAIPPTQGVRFALPTSQPKGRDKEKSKSKASKHEKAPPSKKVKLSEGAKEKKSRRRKKKDERELFDAEGDVEMNLGEEKTRKRKKGRKLGTNGGDEVEDLLVSLAKVIAHKHSERVESSNRSFQASQFALENRGKKLASKLNDETWKIISEAKVALDMSKEQKNVEKAFKDWATASRKSVDWLKSKMGS